MQFAPNDLPVGWIPEHAFYPAIDGGCAPRRLVRPEPLPFARIGNVAETIASLLLHHPAITANPPLPSYHEPSEHAGRVIRVRQSDHPVVRMVAPRTGHPSGRPWRRARKA